MTAQDTDRPEELAAVLDRLKSNGCSCGAASDVRSLIAAFERARADVHHALHVMSWDLDG